MRDDIRVRFVNKLYAVYTPPMLKPNTIFFIEKHRDDLTNNDMFFVYDYSIESDAALNPSFEYYFNLDMYIPENMLDQMPKLLQKLNDLRPDYIAQSVSTAQKLEDFYVRNVSFRIVI